MIKLQFKCQLLSDVILNAKAATKGPNQTLDFIPGSSFLGIVASTLYQKGSADSLRLFHSGEVRFGDAHPSVSNNSEHRTLRGPAMLYYPKLKKITEKCFVSMYIDFRSSDIRKEQPKQCRKGFFDMVDVSKVMEAVVETNFAIKSAYDREHRRSKDAQMYGYESLQKGQSLFFEVEVNSTLDDAVAIKQALVGIHRIGRSRTAQYGLVKISECSYSECVSRSSTKQVTIYADGRLIFLDDNGIPTFQPTPRDLGVDIQGASIKWEKCQLRTFQYAPWNFTRQCFDTDRCGIEKGSVFIVDLPDGVCFESASSYIGAYKNEGFGKVIYNPEFLDANNDGSSKMVFVDVPEEDKLIDGDVAQSTPLIVHLQKHKKEEDDQFAIYSAVNNFVFDNKSIFKGTEFASQWGSIREIATQQYTKKDIVCELFDKFVKHEKVDRYGNVKYESENVAYLEHGIASKKWNKARKECLKKFISSLPEDIVREAVINLAAEMAKNCKR